MPIPTPPIPHDPPYPSDLFGSSVTPGGIISDLPVRRQAKHLYREAYRCYVAFERGYARGFGDGYYKRLSEER